MSRLTIPADSFRPTLIGREQAVACGHYLATLAAMRILDRGGNAIDAGVTAAMALAVLQPDIVCFAGVAPTLIYAAGERQVSSIAGLGYWPAGTDIERLRREGGSAGVPPGLLRSVLPAAPATHIQALRRFGTISFEEAAGPAFTLAREGFAVFPLLAASLKYQAAQFARWPSSAAVFQPGGRIPALGEPFRQPDLAATIGAMIEAERRAAGDRDAKLRAVHDHFYRGPIAAAIDRYHRAEGGFMRLADLEAFAAPVEPSVAVRYQGDEIHVCDAWCQGITMLEAMKILERFDLRALGHNSPDHLHLAAEAFGLAGADREAYVGDPKFVAVPTAGLLADDYAAAQAARISAVRAFGEMPAPGRPAGAAAPYRAPVGASSGRTRAAPDTIYCAVMDRFGNAYSATLSDNADDSPVIPGTGLVISSRGSQSRLEPGHPAMVQPGKRPRLTPAPALALREGVPFIAFGSPGGDVQTQAMLQVFMNVTQFGMRLQQAIEAPRIWSANFPNSFAPHDYHPGRLCVERDIAEATIDELRRRGHSIELWPRMPPGGGAVCAVMRDPVTGLLHAGADPRRESYALAW